MPPTLAFNISTSAWQKKKRSCFLKIIWNRINKLTLFHWYSLSSSLYKLQKLSEDLAAFDHLTFPSPILQYSEQLPINTVNLFCSIFQTPTYLLAFSKRLRHPFVAASVACSHKISDTTTFHEGGHLGRIVREKSLTHNNK